MVCDIDFHRSNRIMIISRSLPFFLSAFLNIIVKLTYRYHYNIQHVHNFYFKLRGNSCQWGVTPPPPPTSPHAQPHTDSRTPLAKASCKSGIFG